MHQKLYITSEQCNSMLLLNRKKKKSVCHFCKGEISAGSIHTGIKKSPI